MRLISIIDTEYEFVMCDIIPQRKPKKNILSKVTRNVILIYIKIYYIDYYNKTSNSRATSGKPIMEKFGDVFNKIF